MEVSLFHSGGPFGGLLPIKVVGMVIMPGETGPVFEDEFPVPCEPQEELVVLEVRGLVLSGTAPEVPLDLFTQGRLDKGMVLPCSKTGRRLVLL